MVEVQTSELVATPAQFSLAQQWVGVGKHCWVDTKQGHTVHEVLTVNKIN
jgi:hypothetical protein